MPISLRHPAISLHAGHAAADRIGDPFRHRIQCKAPVEAETVATKVTPGVLVKVEGVNGAAEADFQVAQQDVDPAKLGQVVRMLATGADDLPRRVVPMDIR